MRDEPSTHQRGMTLLEVLVGLVLLAFTTLGAMSFLSVAMGLNKMAQSRSVATGLAVERVDRLTSQPYQPSASYLAYRLPGETADAGPPLTLTADYGDISGYPDYRRVVTLVYDVPVAGMLQVILDVTWIDVRQGQKLHRVTTYLHPALEEGF